MSDNREPENSNNPWVKSLLVWGGIFLALLLVVSMFGGPREAAGTQISYSDFRNRVAEGSVAEVQIAPEKIVGKLKNGSAFSTVPVPNDTELTGLLVANEVQISGTPSQEPNLLLYILIQSLPFLLILGVAFFALRQVQKGGGSGAMGFGKSKAKMLTEKQGRVTFEDVAGIDEAREELEEIVEFLKDPQRFSKLGGQIPKGALLVGSPGTGKTLLARAIAGEARVPFFTISGSDFVEMFVGVGASRVRDMFEQAKKNAPCIDFIDEIDAVGRHRGHGLGNSNDEREQTLNQLLVEMDGFEANEGIIIIAATNRPDVLDPALLRPGRFDRQVVVPVPDIDGREKILAVHMKKVPLAPDVNSRTIARGTPGFSGADLANLVNEAALLAARRNKRLVAMQEFEDAKDKVMMGAERRSMVMRLPERDNYSYHRDKMHANLAVSMGGRVAEELIFGHDKVSSGASSDISYATSLARNMVTKWGMSDKLGPLQYEDQYEGYLGMGGSQRTMMSDETNKLIDAEIRGLVDGAHARATNILTEHQDQLHLLAQAMLEYETLTGDDIKQLLQDGKLDRPLEPKGPVMTQPVRGSAVPKAGKRFGGQAPQGV
jgi:cell division protease FtsH